MGAAWLMRAKSSVSSTVLLAVSEPDEGVDVIDAEVDEPVALPVEESCIAVVPSLVQATTLAETMLDHDARLRFMVHEFITAERSGDSHPNRRRPTFSPRALATSHPSSNSDRIRCSHSRLRYQRE
jgi:hypothetical protein